MKKIVDAEPSTSARLGELYEIDWRHVESKIVIAEEHHLLPLDHAEHVVLEHDDLHGQLVLDAGGELRHQHLEAAIADECDTLPSGVRDLSRHRVGQPARHRGKGSAQREALAAANSQ